MILSELASDNRCTHPKVKHRGLALGKKIRESAEMVRRYAHLAADHLAPYAERLCATRAMEHETMARFGHSPENGKGLPSASP